MSNLENKTMVQLYQLWIGNWHAMATGIQEILGDEPYPDPREVARQLADMPEDVWISLFGSEGFREQVEKQMSLVKVMVEIQSENNNILETALKRTEGWSGGIE